MLTLHTKLDPAAHGDAPIDGQLVLRYDQREKSRLRTTLESGEDVAFFMLRGTVLRGGDLLKGDDGRVVRVLAAAEPVYRVRCADPMQLLRCAFHLGNRHTQAQIAREAGDAGEAGEAGQCFLRIRQDPVLKEMLQGLGAEVLEETAAFEPEAGAYGGGHHHHGDHPLAPIPLRQRIHRPSDPKEG